MSQEGDEVVEWNVVNQLSHGEGKGAVLRFLRNTGLLKRI